MWIFRLLRRLKWCYALHFDVDCWCWHWIYSQRVAKNACVCARIKWNWIYNNFILCDIFSLQMCTNVPLNEWDELDGWLNKKYAISHFFPHHNFDWQVSLEFSVPFLSIPVKRSVDSMKSWASQSTAFVSVWINPNPICSISFKKYWIEIDFSITASNDEYQFGSNCSDWCRSVGWSCLNFALEIRYEGSTLFQQQ